MTCPNFSRTNEQLFCKVYGVISDSKAQECFSCYANCFEHATVETKKRLSEVEVVRAVPSKGRPSFVDAENRYWSSHYEHKV